MEPPLRSQLPRLRRSLPLPTPHSWGEWVITESVDPLTDAAIYLAFLDSESGVSATGDPIALGLRCIEGAVDLLVLWRTFLADDNVDVVSRVGGAAPQTTQWDISTDRETTFYPESGWQSIEDFIGDAERLVLQVEPYRESPITAVFELAGFNSAAD